MLDLKELRITSIEDFDDVEVVEVLVEEGKMVEVDEAIITIESEKSIMDFPSTEKGMVKRILVSKGDTVHEGDLLMTLEVEHELKSTNEALQNNEAKEVELQEPSPQQDDAVNSQGRKALESDVNAQPNQSDSPSSVYASPGVQKYARELGVNLKDISGSGGNQRILKKDVQDYVHKKLNKQDYRSVPSDGSVATVAINTQSSELSSFGEVEEIELTKIQKVTAANLLSSWQNIPHVTHFDQANITSLEKIRKSFLSTLIDSEIKLTPLAFIVKAVVASLEEYPVFNATLDEINQKIIYKKYFNIGIAVDTPAGLLVPVIRDADKKDIVKIAQDIVQISERARQKKITPDELKGATFTISSLGKLGGQAFTPIINPPEVAILGVSTINIQHVRADNSDEALKFLPLSLSYDHRVINGAEAARFCSYLISILEDYWKIIL